MPSTKKNKNADVEALDEAVRRAHAYLSTDPPPVPRFTFVRPRIDAREIRESLGMSRQDFAMDFSISLRTLQNWEEGRREPEGPARTLLIAIKYAPEAVRRAVSQYRGEPEALARSGGAAAARRSVAHVR